MIFSSGGSFFFTSLTSIFKHYPSFSFGNSVKKFRLLGTVFGNVCCIRVPNEFIVVLWSENSYCIKKSQQYDILQFLLSEAPDKAR